MSLHPFTLPSFLMPPRTKPSQVNLGRAARTDAGVHAAGNVVSIKIITQIPGVPDVVAKVNELLPPEIRLWGYVRVQNSFNARL